MCKKKEADYRAPFFGEASANKACTNGEAQLGASTTSKPVNFSANPILTELKEIPGHAFAINNHVHLMASRVVQARGKIANALAARDGE
ncbi:MAG: hypothetical protein JWL59_2740 [Chthoniobacteraceae bacterium]|nr:hypothetical protein [Chthoniobacteraceae bacterium]